MGTTRLIYRCALLIIIFSAGTILTPFFQRGTMNRTGLAAAITSIWHRMIARALGIKVDIHGTPHDAATLYVSNHISWFDICALGGHLPVRFLSKAEVRTMPLLGWLATSAGTLYIKRGGRKSSTDAIDTMQRALSNDQNVCLFAEGTTTDGNIRKFHSRLIQSAVDAGCTTQPLAIIYPPENPSVECLTHPSVLYTGKITMAESFGQILRAKQLRVEIHFLEPVSSTDKTRDELAQYCEQQVRACIIQSA